MSDELISREAAVHVLCEENINRPLDSDRWLISDIYKKIVELPTIDAVPVVRCRDCVHYIKHDYRCGIWNHGGIVPYGFCFLGERRTDD